MIVESAIAGAMLYGAYRITMSESIKERKEKMEIQKKWDMLMDGIGKQAENKIEQAFEILEIHIKHYGFDAIVSLPYGKKFSDLMSNIPMIESIYKANVMMNMTKEGKNAIYMRVHYLGQGIASKDRLKFQWFKIFYNNDCITKSGELLGIDSVSDIKSPDGTIVGHLVKSKIPVGMAYDKIKSAYDLIAKSLGKCYFEFNHKSMELETTIIFDGISDETKFYPIKCKPWELYVGMRQDWKPVILDYSQNANVLVGGTQGTGKTVALIAAFVNLCMSTKNFDLMVCNIGEKEDLRVFRDVVQCKYYANSKTDLMALLNFLKKEMGKRNKLFSKSKKFCFNIHQYNKMRREEGLSEMKVIHLLGDEIADFMEVEGSQEILWDIIRKSRSAGIYISMASQRASKKNLDSEIKGQFANQICFSQPNTASALTVLSGEDIAPMVLNLEKKREFLINYSEGVKTGKTLCLTTEMMEECLGKVLLSPEKSKENKISIDMNGNIKSEKEEVKEAEHTEDKKGNDTKKAKKEPRCFTNINKNKNKGKKK